MLEIRRKKLYLKPHEVKGNSKNSHLYRMKYSIVLLFGCLFSSISLGAQDSMDSIFVGIPSRDYLMGKFEPLSFPDQFLLLPSKCSEGEQRLRKEVVVAFLKMADSAAKEGVFLRVVSGIRNFDRQKRIWEAKWTGERKVEGRNLAKSRLNAEQNALLIMKYSSMPGTSRHHWGTDLDINSVDDAYFKTKEGCGVYEWLKTHAAHFGFCQVYSSKVDGQRTGYEEEKWHWSYLPLSSPFLAKYRAEFSNSDIRGFIGSEVASTIQAIENFVFGISTHCSSNP